MNPTQLAAIIARRDDIAALAKLHELHELQHSSSGSTEKSNTHLARAFLEKARALNLPPELWFCWINFDRSGYSEGLFGLMQKRHMQGALSVLIGAGASPWPLYLSHPDSRLTSYGLAPIGASWSEPHGGKVDVHFIQPSDIARLIFPSWSIEVAMASRRFALASALDTLSFAPSASAATFLHELLKAYRAATADSSSTSPGLLGSADKSAKACAELMVGHAKAIEQACTNFKPSLVSLARDYALDAQTRLRVKTSQSDTAFNPALLKRNISASQCSRLRSLLLLTERCDEDGEALVALLDATPWLVEHPQVLCVKNRGSHQVAFMALVHARPEILTRMETLGCNLWLASAQSSEGNACRWVAETLGAGLRYHQNSPAAIAAGTVKKARYQACLAPLSRLLVYGAHLDGATDPVEHTVLKIDEALSAPSAKFARTESIKNTLLTLRSLTESLALSDLLAARAYDAAPGARPKPKRSSRSL